MKHLKIVLFTLLMVLAVQADVYVSPEEHRAWAKQGLEEQLAKVPADKQVEFVKAQLAKIPQDRKDLEMQVAEARAAEASGKERKGAPSYFLAKGFEGIDYREEVLKAWLAEHKDGVPQAKPSPSPQSHTPLTPPSLEGQSAKPESDSGTVAALGSTQIVALVLLGAGLLLGARRALA